MPSERYVLLGLAHPRSAWFSAVSQWANTAAVPCEFVKCVSPEELRARLSSGRSYSALLIDVHLPALDRDLVDRAQAAGCSVIGVEDRRAHRDFDGVGIAASLPSTFDRGLLMDVLGAHARRISRGEVPDIPSIAPAPDAWRGRVAAVCGAGGTGTSTVSIALAQGLGERSSVVLADMARHAEQAMLHDARDVVPGIQELVEAHRTGTPSLEDVRSLTFDVVDRRYQLLLGLRRARLWPTLRPRALEAGFDSLTRAYQVVVCDCDPEIEGESDCGSADVEARNVLARTAIDRADVVFVVGDPSMKGLHAMVRVVHDLVDGGVQSMRVVPVVNRAPRQARRRAPISRALAELTVPILGGALCGPLFLPEQPVEEALRDGVKLPTALTQPLAGAFEGIVDATGKKCVPPRTPARVVPGALGSWAMQEQSPG